MTKTTNSEPGSTGPDSVGGRDDQGRNGTDSKPVGSGRLSRARDEDKMARIRAAGEHIARRLNDDDRCYQLQAAIEAGLSERTYFRYMQGDEEEHLVFQSLVLPALYAQAQRNEKTAEGDIASSEGGSSAWMNWHKWKLERRYRKVYGDLAEQTLKLEHTGKDGSPLAGLSVPELVALLEKTK